MTPETLTSSELPACLVYDTFSATPLHHQHEPASSSSNSSRTFIFGGNALAPPSSRIGGDAVPSGVVVAATSGQLRRKRRRQQRSCKKEGEAESQRMTHIAVERNRRRLMSDHLNVLHSLMPESYIQRVDQASIVGGAIDFVKELEHLLQSLEVQKRTMQQQRQQAKDEGTLSGGIESSRNDITGVRCSSNSYYNHKQYNQCNQPPFAHFFAYPQYIWSHSPRDYPLPGPENQSAVADIEVTLIETYGNLRILTLRRPRQHLGMVAGLQALRLSILHLNVTTLDSMVLYSLSVKVEEECNLTTVDDIASAVHQMLTLMDADANATTLAQ